MWMNSRRHPLSLVYGDMSSRISWKSRHDLDTSYIDFLSLSLGYLWFILSGFIESFQSINLFPICLITATVVPNAHGCRLLVACSGCMVRCWWCCWWSVAELDSFFLLGNHLFLNDRKFLTAWPIGKLANLPKIAADIRDNVPNLR